MLPLKNLLGTPLLPLQEQKVYKVFILRITMIKRNNKFIPIEQINFNTAGSQFKYNRSGFKVLGCVGVMGLSLVIPDGSFFIVLGVMLLSPVALLPQLKEKKNDIRLYINKRLVLWGLK